MLYIHFTVMVKYSIFHETSEADRTSSDVPVPSAGQSFKKEISMDDKLVMHKKTNSRELFLVSCGYEKCQPAQSYGPSARRYYMIHFILEGQGHYYINDRHFLIDKNQCFLIPPDVVTLYKAEPSNPWTYVWICFNGEFAQSLVKHCHFTEDSLILPVSDIFKYKDLIFEMMQHPKLTPANDCFIQSCLYRIMAMLEEQSHASYSDLESLDNFYISRAVDYINRSTVLDITVNEVAEYLHISRSYLFELFRRHLNTSPQTFLIAAKIANARELLLQTDISIENIALSCGYQNPFAFSRAFKKETGMTPREYRLKCASNGNLLNH